MATRIIRVCDQHAERDEEVEGAEWIITLQPPGTRAQTFSVDLCDDDGKPLQALLGFLRELGRAPEPAAPGKRPYTRRADLRPTTAPAGTGEAATGATEGRTEDSLACPACEDYVARTRGALASHAQRIHGKSISELRGQAADLPCPECGQRFVNAQGRAAHRRRTHGVRGQGAQGAA